MQRLIPVSNREAWQRCLDRSRHAPAHSWDYCVSIAERTRRPVYLYECEDQNGCVICSLLERNYSGHASVCILPGFSGLAGEIDETVWLGQFTEFSLSHNWVCAYMGLHPIFAPPGLRRLPMYRSHNEIYVMDIAGTEDLLKSRMSYNRRREVEQLHKAGVEIIKDKAVVAQFFKNNFSGFMLRKRVKLHDDELWPTTDRFLLAPNALLLGAGAPGGPIEAASVFGYTPHCGDFWYAISKDDGVRFSKALLWSAVRELRALGVSLLNLGGGVRPGDEIAATKRRFGGVPRELGSLQLVFQPDLYDDLCKSRAARTAAYFPAYHAPVEG
jgi:hypothetical protein